MRSHLAIVVAALSLTGWASGFTAGEVLAASSAGSGAARLVIYRSSFGGFVVQPNYLVDGKVIASSQALSFVTCNLPPGRHEVAIANLPSISPFARGSEKVTVNLRAGSTTYLSANPQMGILTPGKITLTEVTESQGRSDVATLHQTTGTCGKG
jgi:hypothetical protein